jgi:hypothetical protein
MKALLVLVPTLVLIAACTPAQTETAGQAHSGMEWQERIRIASGDAYQGPWRMNQSEFLYVDDPAVGINDSGVVGVVWVDQARKDVYLQIYEPGGERRFAEPVNVSGSPNVFSWLPRMVMSPGDANKVYILWQEIVFSGGSHGGEIFFARSTDGGRTFSRPLNLSNTIAGAGKGRLTQRYWHNGSLDLATGHDGTLHAAWTEFEGALWFSRSTDGGSSFSEPLRVAGSGAIPARGPSLAVGEDDVVHLAWTVGEDAAADIHVSSSNDGGRSFSEPRRVFESSGHADAPKIAVDRKGTVHLVYAESSAGPLQHYRVHYARSRDGARTFEEPRDISGSHAQEFTSVHFPALSLDAEDRLYLIWELFPAGAQRPQGLGFLVSSDGGESFTPPSVVPGSADPALGDNGSRQGLLMNKLAANEAGAIAVVNSTFRSNEQSRVWLFRGQFAKR